jgi:predicted small lipoprotein YifL
MKTVTVLVMIALSLSVTACGRKGAPKPMPNALYPQTYPPNVKSETWELPPDDQNPGPVTTQQ